VWCGQVGGGSAGLGGGSGVFEIRQVEHELCGVEVEGVVMTVGVSPPPWRRSQFLGAPKLEVTVYWCAKTVCLFVKLPHR